MQPDPASRDAAILLDIRIAGAHIREFIAGMKLDGFLRDAKTQSAVLHQILVIGEASRRLSARLQEQHPAIPWSRIGAMRNRLIHGYDDVDLDVVWDTATIHVPRLLKDVEPLLPPESKGG